MGCMGAIAHAAYHLGAVRQIQGEKEKAREYYETAIRELSAPGVRDAANLAQAREMLENLNDSDRKSIFRKLFSK